MRHRPLRTFPIVVAIGLVTALVPVSGTAIAAPDPGGTRPLAGVADDDHDDPFGSTPDVAHRGAPWLLASLDGDPVPLQWQVTDGGDTLLHLYGGFGFTLIPRCGSDLDGTLMRVRPGGSFDVRVSGLEADTPIEAWWFPGAARLGTARSSADGEATLTLRAPDDLDARSGTVYLRGFFDGVIRDDVVPDEPEPEPEPERRLMEITVGIGALPAIFPFTDIGPSSTHGLAVRCLTERGVIRGTSATTFDPWGAVTRGQAASLLAREAGLVGGSSSHGAAVQALADLGVMEGYADGTLGLRDPVTRGQAASLLARLHELPPAPTRFTDAGGVHRGAIGALASRGVVRGYEDGTFGTDDEVQRAAFASMMYRFEQSQLRAR